MTEHTGVACACCGNAPQRPDHTRLSRRHLLRASVAGAMAGALGAGLPLALPSPANAFAVSSPDEALKLLLDGNERFFQRKITFHQDDLTIIQQNTVAKNGQGSAFDVVRDHVIPRVHCGRRLGRLH